ncbi:MAG: hypothetical protein IT518_14585 [Burkholderiales bacterium]|nr:hypothetical protein [Burkholderiales bacterium]
MKMPDLHLRPTPAYVRYARQARAAARRARRIAWWQENRDRINAVAYLVLLAAVGVLVLLLWQAQQRMAELDARVLRQVAHQEQITDLVLRLARPTNTGRLLIRLNADGNDEAIVLLEQMREVLVAERGVAQ